MNNGNNAKKASDLNLLLDIKMTISKKMDRVLKTLDKILPIAILILQFAQALVDFVQRFI